MKRPKTTNRYCPYCKKRTEQKIKEPSKGKASSMKRGSKTRIRLRGRWRGIGNQGKYSRLKNQTKKKEKRLKKQISCLPVLYVKNLNIKIKENEPPK